jgi:hypothetical protein
MFKKFVIIMIRHRHRPSELTCTIVNNALNLTLMPSIQHHGVIFNAGTSSVALY